MMSIARDMCIVASCCAPGTQLPDAADSPLSAVSAPQQWPPLAHPHIARVLECLVDCVTHAFLLRVPFVAPSTVLYPYAYGTRALAYALTRYRTLQHHPTTQCSLSAKGATPAQ